MGDDQHLDKELSCSSCEEGPDPADVVEFKSAGSGHRSDVCSAALLIVQCHIKLSGSWRRRSSDVLDSDQ